MLFKITPLKLLVDIFQNIQVKTFKTKFKIEIQIQIQISSITYFKYFQMAKLSVNVQSQKLITQTCPYCFKQEFPALAKQTCLNELLFAKILQNSSSCKTLTTLNNSNLYYGVERSARLMLLIKTPSISDLFLKMQERITKGFLIVYDP